MSLDWQIEHLPVCASTMDEVDRRAREGAAEGLVIVTDEQTAGRGRMGRQWLSPPASSLMASLLFRPSFPVERLSLLPLMLGVAASEAIEVCFATPVQLKWPNDLMIGGKKTGGILVQSRLKPGGIEAVIAGIGINLTTPVEALPDGATSIAIHSNALVTRDHLLSELLARVGLHWEELSSAGGSWSIDHWTARAAMIGEEISLILPRGEVTGLFTGIDGSGRLCLRHQDGGVEALAIGEITRGPRIALGQ